MQSDKKVYVIFYTEGDSIAVCAPSFDCAVHAAVASINEGVPTMSDDWVTIEQFESWIERVELVSRNPIVMWIGPTP